MRLDYDDLADLAPLLSWADLLRGYQRQVLDEGTVVRVAVDRLDEAATSAQEQLALLLSDQYDRVPALLAEAAGPAMGGDDLLLFLLLRKAYRERGSVSDPLAVVEDLYEDFDHAEQLDPLIRYMPPAPGEQPVGEAGLIARWGRMVADRQEQHRARLAT